MSRYWNAIALCALFLLASLPSTSLAQRPSLSGTYRYVEAESDAIGPAIEAAVARMNFITRPIARGRLTRTNTPYQTIRIGEATDQVTIVTDQRAPIVSPTDGTPIAWTREDGEVLDVNTRWVDGTLEQTFVAEDGERKNAYSLAPDGNVLELRVTVTSPRLSGPLTYTLRYRRQT